MQINPPHSPQPTRSKPSSFKPFSKRKQIHSSIAYDIVRSVVLRCFSNGILNTFLLFASAMVKQQQMI